jgi:DNA-directed RNA polymerase subunit RPC12/RpoP
MSNFDNYPNTDLWTWHIEGNVYVECPECKSKIRLDALRCKHCSSDVSETFGVWSEAYRYLVPLEIKQARIDSIKGIVKAIVLWAVVLAALWLYFD